METQRSQKYTKGVMYEVAFIYWDMVVHWCLVHSMVHYLQCMGQKSIICFIACNVLKVLHRVV